MGLAARLFDRTARRIKLLITRGVVNLVDAGALLQALQVEALSGEVLDQVEHFEPYGFTSHPLPGAEALLLSLNGRRSHTLAGVVTDRRHRKTGLAPGEAALYSHEGDYVHLKNGRIIEVLAGAKVKVTAPEAEVIASTKVSLTTPLTELSGNLVVAGLITGAAGLSISGGSGAQISGDVTVNGGDVAADGIALKAHVHGGVEPGAGTTGPAQ